MTTEFGYDPLGEMSDNYSELRSQFYYDCVFRLIDRTGQNELHGYRSVISNYVPLEWVFLEETADYSVEKSASFIMHRSATSKQVSCDHEPAGIRAAGVITYARSAVQPGRKGFV